VKRPLLILLIGVAVGIALALPLVAFASIAPSSSDSGPGMKGMMAEMMHSTSRPEDQGEISETHRQMHEMMDAMMGEGSSERMHKTMPTSEAMMEQCASMTDMMRNMQGMTDSMNGVGGMKDGSGMMGRNDLDSHEGIGTQR
jgi:hypothetical protein